MDIFQLYNSMPSFKEKLQTLNTQSKTNILQAIGIFQRNQQNDPKEQWKQWLAHNNDFITQWSELEKLSKEQINLLSTILFPEFMPRISHETKDKLLQAKSSFLLHHEEMTIDKIHIIESHKDRPSMWPYSEPCFAGKNPLELAAVLQFTLWEYTLKENQKCEAFYWLFSSAPHKKSAQTILDKILTPQHRNDSDLEELYTALENNNKKIDSHTQPKKWITAAIKEIDNQRIQLPASINLNKEWKAYLDKTTNDLIASAIKSNGLLHNIELHNQFLLFVILQMTPQSVIERIARHKTPLAISQLHSLLNIISINSFILRYPTSTYDKQILIKRIQDELMEETKTPDDMTTVKIVRILESKCGATLHPYWSRTSKEILDQPPKTTDQSSHKRTESTTTLKHS